MVRYRADGRSTPTIDLSTRSGNGDSFDVRVTATSFDSAASVIFTSGETSDLDFSGSDGAEYRIEVDRTAPDGSTTSVSATEVRIELGEMVTLPLEAWAVGGQLDAEVTSSLGADRTVTLT